MSKIDVHVGQLWVEKRYSRRSIKIDSLLPNGCKFSVLSWVGGGDIKLTGEMMLSTLRSGFALLKQAPDAMPQRIAIALAHDTTATECGACSMLDEYEYGGLGCCHAFDDKTPPNPGGIRQRLPECIAAEVAP